LAALMNPSLSLGGLPAGFPGVTGGSIGAAQSNLPGTRQARRLYVGGIPIPIAEVELKQFFDVAMRSAFPDLPAGESVVSVYLNLDKKFAFVEFRTPEEATTGLGLDGIVMRGMTLRIKRPSDYNPSLHGSAPSASRISAAPMGGGAGGGAAAPFSGAVSSQVPDGPNKVFCGGLPYSLSEPEVMELLSSFGQLRAFHLVKDRETQQSKGCQLNTRTFHQSLRACAAPMRGDPCGSCEFVALFILFVSFCPDCFFEFVDPSVTDTAVAGLNNLNIGDKRLSVRRAQPKADMLGVGGSMGVAAQVGQIGGGVPGGLAGLGEMASQLTPAQLAALAALRSQGMSGAGAAAPTIPIIPSGAPVAPVGPPPTRVLVMQQMVVPEILRDDAEYREIFEDIESECRRFGEVRAVVIPRPLPPGPGSGAHVPGLGKVFVEFAAMEHAVKARAEIEGRQFDGRTVATTFLEEDKWARRELD
jgi:splicing factor U2AF subunit